MNMLDKALCTIIVAALGHFLWQGTLLAGVAALASRWLTTPRSRYMALVVTLGIMAFCPVVTVAVPWLTAEKAAPVAKPVPAVVPPAIAESSLQPASPAIPVREVVTPAQGDVSKPATPLLIQKSPAITEKSSAPHEAVTVAVPELAQNTNWQWLVSAVLGTYLLGVAAMILRLAVGLWGGWKLRRLSTPIVTPELREAIQRQTQALGLKLVPVLACCERVAVPTVVGVLKPTILLPLSLMSGLSPDQVEAILAHELAHIRRYDHLVNLLQRMIESLLFFHPAVWWVSHRIRVEREHCCDDLAVACGAVPLDYAASLLKVAELGRASRRQRALVSVGLGATGKVSTLRERIARLLGDPATPQVRMAHSLFVLALGATGCVLAWLATSVLWEQDAAADEKAPETRVVVVWPAMVSEEVLDELGRVQYDEKYRAVEQKIWKVLETRVSVKTEAQSLESALAGFSQRYGISIRFDEDALKAESIRKQAPIRSSELSETAFQNVLRILMPQRLSFVVEDGALIVTTMSKASRRPFPPKPSRIKDPATGLMTLRCSAESLREVLRSHLSQQAHLAPGDQVNFITPQNQEKPGNNVVLYPSSVLGDLKGSPSVGSIVEGKLRMEVEKDQTLLQADLKARTQIGFAHGNAELKLTDRLNRGQAVAYIVPTGSKEKEPSSLLLVFETTSVPTDHLEKFALQTRLPDWIRLGPAKSNVRAAQAVAWKARAQRHVSDLNPAWTRDLPNGGHVQLVAISRPMRAPMIWWTPDGEPIAGVAPSNNPGYEVAALVRVWEDKARRTPVLPKGTIVQGILDPFDRKASDALTERIASQLKVVPAQLVDKDGKPGISIGAGFGPWTAETRLEKQKMAAGSLHGIPIKTITSVELIKGSSGTHFNWTPTREFDFTVLAVNKRGDQIASISEPILSANEPESSMFFEHPLPIAEIDHFLVKSRASAWAEFYGIVVRPAGLESLLAESETPSAKLPNGVTVELAGVTKYAKSVYGGWRPNGAQIDDSPEWPIADDVLRTIPFRDRRTHDLPMHANMRDFLFEFRGLRQQPSLRFMPELRNRQAEDPLREPYRVRAIGTVHKNVLETSVSVAIAADPWGKYQQVGNGGVLLNRIEKTDPHWPTYQTIQIARPDQSELKGPPHFREQFIMRQPEDAESRYDLEMLAIDTNGKSYPARPYGMQTLSGTRLKECIWVPGDYFPKGKFVRFEYRLRPYRHVVKFDHVSLRMGEASTPKVSITTLEEPQPEDKATVTRRLINWSRSLADGSSQEKIKAATEIRKWVFENRPEEIDERLIKSLAKRLGDPEPTPAEKVGKFSRQSVGVSCRETLQVIGRPAIPELVTVLKEGNATARERAIECLGAIKFVGPAAVAALIAVKDDPSEVLDDKSSEALKQMLHEPSLIPQLIVAAENKSVMLRHRAVGLLAILKDDRAEGVLVKAFQDPEPKVWKWALSGAIMVPRPKLAAKYIELLSTDDLDKRQLLTEALVKVAKQSVEPVLVGMESKDARVRAACVEAARGIIGEAGPRVIPLLTKALLDSDAKVRQAALRAVSFDASKFEREPLVNALLANLQHDDPMVRTRAANASISVADAWPTDRRLIPSLLKLLQESKPMLHHSNGIPNTLLEAIEAVGRYREKEAVPRLLELLESQDPIVLAPGGFIPGRTFDALVRIGDPRTIPVLRKLAQQKKPEAIESLGEFHDRELIPLFIEFLNDPQPKVRFAAAKALSQLPDPRATVPLIAALNREAADPRNDFVYSRNILIRIADALGANRDARGIAALVAKIEATYDLSGVGIAVITSFSSEYIRPSSERGFRLHPFAAGLAQGGVVGIPELVKGLTSSSHYVRGVCAYALANLKIEKNATIPTVAPFQATMLSTLRRGDFAVRQLMFRAIGHIRFPEFEPVLIAMLEGAPAGTKIMGESFGQPESDYRILPEIVKALANYRSEAVRNALNRALQHGNFRVKAEAAAGLESFPSSGFNKKMVTWMRALSNGTPDEQAQAAADIADWAADNQPDVVDPRLTKALIKRMDLTEMTSPKSRNGPNPGRPVGYWCKFAVKKVGRPAVPELLPIVKTSNQETRAIRSAALECLNEIKTIGPEAITVLLAMIEQPDSELWGPAFIILQRFPQDPVIISKLIEISQTGSVKDRARKVGMLGAFRDERIDVILKKALESREREVKLAAVGIITHFPRPHLAKDLVAQLKNDEWFIRNQVTFAFFKMAKPCAEILLEGLQSDDFRVREGCTQAIVWTFPETAARTVPLITKALLDPSGAVRIQAMQAVISNPGKFDSSAICDAILANIKHADAKVRTQAASTAMYCSYHSIQDKRLIPALLVALDESDPQVVMHAVHAIAIYRDLQAVPKLIRLAENSPKIRRAALQALGEIDDPRSLPIIRKFAAESNPAAIVALGKLRDRESIPLLIAALEDPGEETHTAAAEALQTLPDPRAVPALIKAFDQRTRIMHGQSPNNFVRYLARALGATGDPQAIAALLAKINTFDPQFTRHDLSRNTTTGWVDPISDLEFHTHPLAEPLCHASTAGLLELAKGLTSKPPLTRRICAYALSQPYGASESRKAPDSAEFRAQLLASFQDPDLKVRVLTIRTAGNLKMPEAEPALLAILEKPVPTPDEDFGRTPQYSPDAIVRVETVRALSHFRNERVGNALVRAFDHPDGLVRTAIVNYIGPFPNSQKAPLLLKALNDPQAAENSARLLGLMGDSRAVAPLIAILKDAKKQSNESLQAQAAESLGLLGSADAVPVLKEILRKIPAGDDTSPGFRVQLAAAVSLVQFQDVAGTERLRELLVRRDSSTRYAAISALQSAHHYSNYRKPARLSHEPTRAMLREYIERGPEVRERRLMLLEILGDQQDPATREFLERLTGDPNSDFKWNALLLLAKADPVAFEEKLLRCSMESPKWTRTQCVSLLARIPSEQVTIRLIAMTSDNYDELKFAAIRALEKRPGDAITARLKRLSTDPAPPVSELATQVLASRLGAKGK